MSDSGEARIPQRHVAELGCFFATHDRWLFGHACVRTHGDRELAADLVQDTFEAAARAWATLRGARRRSAAGSPTSTPGTRPPRPTPRPRPRRRSPPSWAWRRARCTLI